MTPKTQKLVAMIVFWTLVFLFTAWTSCAAETPKVPATAERAKYRVGEYLIKTFPGYADEIVRDPRFDFEPRLLERFTKPKKPSTKPRSRPPRHNFDYVVNDWSKKTGLQFMAEHEAVFAAAEDQFPTVPKEVPAGILDAETQFGFRLAKADYPVLQTLLTIAVFRPNFQRPGWAKDELTSFLRISQKNQWDPYQRLGSWTGAMWKPQFEPSSYEDLAMHWNGTSCVTWKSSNVSADLDNDDDAICSIFNYLYRNGFGGGERRWRRALHRYNKNWYYCDAILDVADFFAGRPDHHHYQTVAERMHARIRKRIVPQRNQGAASK